MRTRPLVALALALTAMTAGAADSPTVFDAQLLEWMKGIGFPVWAVVLLVVGNRIVSAMHDFFTTLNRHVTQTERRLARLEAVVFMHRRPGHFTQVDDEDDPLP